MKIELDIPEIRIVRRELEERGLDAVVVLGVLLKSMMDNHMAMRPTLEEAEDPNDHYPRGVTLLDALFHLLQQDKERNRQYLDRVCPPDVPDDALTGAAKAACEMYMTQDDVRELLAVCIDTADMIYDAQQDREAA